MLLWYNNTTDNCNVALSSNLLSKFKIIGFGPKPNCAERIADRFIVITIFPSSISFTAITLDEEQKSWHGRKRSGVWVVYGIQKDEERTDTSVLYGW